MTARPWSSTCALAIAFATGLPGAAPAQGPAAAEEYRLKAAYVPRFAQFVEWPAQALAGRLAAELCVSAPPRFVDSLKQLTADERIAGLPVAVRSIDDRAPVDTCHLLFVGAGSTADVRELLRDVGPRATLTVGDSPQFLDDGGMIALRVVERRVRFDIDVGAAERARLRLSSRLLRLALAVRGAPR